MAWIQSLAWELAYATGAAIKNKTKQTNKKNRKHQQLIFVL